MRAWLVVVVAVGSCCSGCGPGLQARLLQQEHEAQRYRASFEAEGDARAACVEALRAAEARAAAAEATAAAGAAELARLRAAEAASAAAALARLEVVRAALAPELAAGRVTLGAEGGRLAIGLQGPVEGKPAQALLRRVLQALGPAAQEARLELVLPGR